MTNTSVNTLNSDLTGSILAEGDVVIYPRPRYSELAIGQVVRLTAKGIRLHPLEKVSDGVYEWKDVSGNIGFKGDFILYKNSSKINGIKVIQPDW